MRVGEQKASYNPDSDPTKRFTIIGAGAIGGIVGAHLIRAGYEVTFIEANQEHVEAIRGRGLKITGTEEFTVHPVILTPNEARGPLGQVFLAVKSHHTEQAIEPFAATLADDGYVLSLQNGLEEYKIARLVGEERTVGAFLTFGGHYLRPGEVVYGGPGAFRIGELDGKRTERVVRLQQVLSSLQDVEITGNIFGFLWAKIALGAVYFATALVSEDVPDLLEHEKYRELFGNIAAEVVAVAESDGVNLETFDGFDPTAFRFNSPRNKELIEKNWDAQRAYWGGHVQRRTGVWRDLAVHRRKTEVDELVGNIISRAEQHGIEVPRVQAIVRMIHEIESGQRQLGPHNLEELCDIDAQAQRSVKAKV